MLWGKEHHVILLWTVSEVLTTVWFLAVVNLCGYLIGGWSVHVSVLSPHPPWGQFLLKTYAWLYDANSSFCLWQETVLSNKTCLHIHLGHIVALLPGIVHLKWAELPNSTRNCHFASAALTAHCRDPRLFPVNKSSWYSRVGHNLTLCKAKCICSQDLAHLNSQVVEWLCK